MHGDERSVTHPAHSRIWELLPWYLNDSLDGDERAEVRAHLGECLVCTREIHRLERLHAAVSAPLATQASAQGYARLAARIDSGEQASGFAARFAAGLRSLFEPVPLIAGASLLVVSSLLVSVIVNSGDQHLDGAEPNRAFQTLGQSLGQADDGLSVVGFPLVRIVLDGGLGDEAVADWLLRHRARIIDGPSDIGVLTMRVDVRNRDFEQAIASIRADEHTLFVEPVDRIGKRPDRNR